MTDDGPADVGQPIDLGSLARGSDGAAPVPATSLRVLDVHERTPFGAEGEGADGAWLVLLEGHLLVDLPFGDFRELHPGHALEIPGDVAVTLDPVEPSVVLIGRRRRARVAAASDVS